MTEEISNTGFEIICRNKYNIIYKPYLPAKLRHSDFTSHSLFHVKRDPINVNV
jgi:hypothetical protein